ncbi:transcriptional regulator EpsA [Methylobacillus arboreus]|uniref:XrtB/PEP-CTERM-associated transcriptional regulator EpsA n=1 Tax=Methylobacillus arboreus TaxID=755170 RepID=UPI001E4E5F59|nr:XrtB/PEP-CTERM-associated transcriptional regulator EpsA [Methylobacillus arboreus]MCB5189312.1 transcriptional regulator EpsA [Methylobacillus arboreus]
MSLNKNLNDIEKSQLIELMHESLRIRSHFELFLWMQGKLQIFLPHEIMITAWGDFSLGVIYFNIVSPLPGIRSDKIASQEINQFLQNLFNYWLNHAKAPFTLAAADNILHDYQFSNAESSYYLKNMKSALVHAIKDHRGRHDCLYVLLSSNLSFPPASRPMLEALLPYIDSALRQIEHLPEQQPTPIKIEPEPKDETLNILSGRELEIMDWVTKGKTNQEIGMILDISAFTVKNHLQRIFKKLNVLNRAQAVSKFRK